jgi:hypothetical protein
MHVRSKLFLMFLAIIFMVMYNCFNATSLGLMHAVSLLGVELLDTTRATMLLSHWPRTSCLNKNPSHPISVFLNAQQFIHLRSSLWISTTCTWLRVLFSLRLTRSNPHTPMNMIILFRLRITIRPLYPRVDIYTANDYTRALRLQTSYRGEEANKKIQPLHQRNKRLRF